MEELSTYLFSFFIFAFAINGLLAISILILKNRPFRIANILLAVNLAGFALASVMISLVESHLILAVPHFIRIPSPLYYASFPAGYLYVRLILKDENRLQWYDFLHFLPAVFHLIEMIPFYLLDTETKLAHINFILSNKIELYEHNEGWLPPFIHNILRGVSALTYAILMWNLLMKFKKKNLTYPLAKVMIKWLNLFTVDNAAMGILLIFLLVVRFIPNEIRSLALNTCLFSGLIAANFFLFFKPEILYGLPQPIHKNLDQLKNTEKPISVHYESDNSFIDEDKEDSEIPKFIFEYKIKVDTYLKESLRYLDPKFNLHDLSRETGLPKHHLQLLINKAENKRFQDFINEYRITYLQNLVNHGALNTKTLVALASESGFNSKATFFRIIKKTTGKTPKEYFNFYKS